MSVPCFKPVRENGEPIEFKLEKRLLLPVEPGVNRLIKKGTHEVSVSDGKIIIDGKPLKSGELSAEDLKRIIPLLGEFRYIPADHIVRQNFGPVSSLSEEQINLLMRLTGRGDVLFDELEDRVIQVGPHLYFETLPFYSGEGPYLAREVRQRAGEVISTAKSWLKEKLPNLSGLTDGEIVFLWLKRNVPVVIVPRASTTMFEHYTDADLYYTAEWRQIGQISAQFRAIKCQDMVEMISFEISGRGAVYSGTYAYPGQPKNRHEREFKERLLVVA